MVVALLDQVEIFVADGKPIFSILFNSHLIKPSGVEMNWRCDIPNAIWLIVYVRTYLRSAVLHKYFEPIFGERKSVSKRVLFSQSMWYPDKINHCIESLLGYAENISSLFFPRKMFWHCSAWFAVQFAMTLGSKCLHRVRPETLS